MNSEPVEPLTTECKQVVTMRMRDSLLTRLRYTAAQVPRMVETHTSVCAAMFKGTPGKTLRRILERYRVQVKAADVFWGWVAQESIEGWLQLSGGRPQSGKGKPLMEWRVQAAEAGGWGGMLAGGDSAWFASFRMKVRQQMLQMSEEAVPQVTQTMVQQVWMTSAKSQTKQANAGKQCRKIYDTALAQLHQQREIALVGTAAKLLARRKLVAAMRATVASGALPKVLRAEAVVDVTKAVPVRDVVIDMCAGRQSMKGPARRQGYRYVAVEIDAVISAVRGLQRADVVLDLRQVTAAELVAVVAQIAGVQVAEILLIWASIPCNTVSRLDPGNQRPGYTVHREYSTREGDVQCALGSVVVVGGTREPQTARAEEDDGIHATVLRALDAAFNLYGIHYAVENPKAQLGLRPVVLAQERSDRLYCRRVNYCQYQHIFAKDTNVWTTVAAWKPRGLSGTGLCRAATGYCSKNKKKTGEINAKTGRWNHDYIVGGLASKAFKGPAKDEMQNRVPANLLKELLQAM